MTRQFNTCPIWGTAYEANGYVVPDSNEITIEHSERADGGYVIPSSLFRDIGSLDNSHKARLVTWLIDQRSQGVNLPKITVEVLDYTRSKRPLPVYERADRLLRLLASRVETVASTVTFRKNFWSTYAWSESTKWEEVNYLLNYLESMRWIVLHRDMAGSFLISITVSGHNRIGEQRTSVDSSQGFTAMWFDDSMAEVFEQGIKPAIEAAGYEPLRIDQKEHINKIDDEIIAEIQRSRFLVADFTHGEDGARGGVYYEAGFAHGLGIPVIFTCRKDAVETLHFDTSHYSHIFWTTPEELREKLKNRILAVIGEGPEARRIP